MARGIRYICRFICVLFVCYLYVIRVLFVCYLCVIRMLLFVYYLCVTRVLFANQDKGLWVWADV